MFDSAIFLLLTQCPIVIAYLVIETIAVVAVIGFFIVMGSLIWAIINDPTDDY